MVDLLAGKSVFVFDWDGTLFDSMPIKFRTFSRVLAELIQPHASEPLVALQARVRDRYRELSGIPRRQIVEQIAIDFGLSPETIDFETFSTRLTRVNQVELAGTQLFTDAATCLDRLIHAESPVYISSSVPQVELSALVEAHVATHLLPHLAGIFGSDGPLVKGRPHVERILDHSLAEIDALMFFGDDEADLKLCQQAGVDCILVDREGKFQGRVDELKSEPGLVSIVTNLDDVGTGS